MLGENTVVFTREGFKMVKDLVLFDEVLTPFGEFEPIVEMSPWEEMSCKVSLDSVEDIYCSDNVLWALEGSYKYTDELGDNASLVKSYIAFEGKDDELEFDPYGYAVVVPMDVPLKVMMGSLKTKLSFLAGLIDSPMCELGSSEGIYKFYISDKFKSLADEIMAFVRVLGIGVGRKYRDGVYCITVNITKYVDILPIKDELKDCYDYASFNTRINILKVDNNLSINDKCMGRMIKVNRGFFFAGYSMAVIA